MNFRYRALQGLREPDELDTALRLASPRTWIAAWTVAAVLAAGIVWAFVAHIPRIAVGDGLLTHPLGVSKVQSLVTGIVAAVQVTSGDEVKVGQSLVQVASTTGAVKNVLAPFPGRLISLSVGSGQLLRTGSTVATIERTDAADDRLLALVAVPAADAMTIRPGAHVNLTVSTAPAQAFGVLRGTVFSVGALPLSPAEYQAYFGQAALISRLGTSKPYVLTTVNLDKNTSTTSGYRWSSGAGPPFRLDSQIEVSAAITVTDQHPISLVLNG